MRTETVVGFGLYNTYKLGGLEYHTGCSRGPRGNVHVGGRAFGCQIRTRQELGSDAISWFLSKSKTERNGSTLSSAKLGVEMD